MRIDDVISELQIEQKRRHSAFPLAVEKGLATRERCDTRNNLLEDAIDRLKRQRDAEEAAKIKGRPTKRTDRARPGQGDGDGTINEAIRDSLNLPSTEPQKAIGLCRSELADELAAGEMTVCPCCGRTAKAYARALYSSMVKALELVAKNGPMTSAQIIGALKIAGGGDHHKLEHFGLLKRVGAKADRWAITPEGRLFLAGKLSVPIHMLMWDKRFIGMDMSRMVRVNEIKGLEHFDTKIWSEKAVSDAELEPA